MHVIFLEVLTSCKLKLFKVKIGTPVPEGNVNTNFGFLHFFCFQVLDRRTDGRAIPIMRPMRTGQPCNNSK